MSEKDDARGSRFPKPRRSTTLALVGVALALAVTGGWYATAGHAAGQVSVAWAGPPRCVVAEYGPVRGIGPRQAIHARRGSTCTIAVEIRNDSARTVRLERLVAPYMGRSGGGVLKADPQPPTTDAQRRLGDDTDAYYPLDRELGAGETHRVALTLGFRERGCSHARTTFAGFPTLELTVLGRGDLTVAAVDDLVFIQQGPSSACKAP